MVKARLPLDPVADLRRRLARRTTRALRGTVVRWWADHGLASHPAIVGKRIALALIEQRHTEPKLAGMLVLHELLADHLRASDLPGFARLYADDHLADERVADWFATRVLGAVLARPRGRLDAVIALVGWRDAASPWQRRGACVALAGIASQRDLGLPGLVPLVLSVCASVLWSPERCDHLAAGWLLRELSRAEPERACAFFRRHARLMTRECARAAVAELPAPVRAQLLAVHRRATTLTR